MIISVVTPSYNQGEFLAETIESIIGQEGNFVLDYIVIDGGSDDDSVSIIKHYARLLARGEWPVKCCDIRFRWLSEKDRGQADALAKGFRLAEGDILAWLNSDDVYLPGTLQSVTAFFGGHPGTALLYGAAHYCDTAGNIIGSYPTEAFEFTKLAWANFFCQPSAFFTKAAFVAVGGIDDTLQYCMDYDLFIRIARQFDCRYLPQLLAKYRLHETAKTMRDDVLFDNHEETLRVAMKYFGWAPINRVYGSCNYYCRSRFPRFLVRCHPLAIGAALLCSVFRSLRLNRGMRKAELKLLTMTNFRKLFKERIDILRG
jgi:glycosyltransferase involved in cell wall biosynthesis